VFPVNISRTYVQIRFREIVLGKWKKLTYLENVRIFEIPLDPVRETSRESSSRGNTKTPSQASPKEQKATKGRRDAEKRRERKGIARKERKRQEGGRKAALKERRDVASRSSLGRDEGEKYSKGEIPDGRLRAILCACIQHVQTPAT